jgi:hypothetical protein
MYAAKLDRVAALRLLLEEHANLEATDNVRESTAGTILVALNCWLLLLEL